MKWNSRYEKNKWKMICNWSFRRVYEVKDKTLRGSYVIKKAKSLWWVWHNINEFEISHTHHIQLEWNNVPKMYPKIIDISNDWVWMLVEKAVVCTDLPERMYKAFEWDIKPCNFWYIWEYLVKLDFWMLPAYVLNHYNNTRLKFFK